MTFFIIFKYICKYLINDFNIKEILYMYIEILKEALIIVKVKK